ncbi:hypothetical protein KY285_024693 [Solanum tuberosum]|nr:hypothetical protein KY284_024660 [Solanum tuberosum]KAH0676892.1 hypothetical protein KY285_024693 [Solanum tuberosum]
MYNFAPWDLTINDVCCNLIHKFTLLLTYLGPGKDMVVGSSEPPSTPGILRLRKPYP